MDLLVNELSLHGQFGSTEGFVLALETMMRMRELARRHERSIRVATALPERKVTTTIRLRDYIQRHPDINVRRALLSWLTKDGPFLEDDQLHQPNDTVSCLGRSVVGSSVAEAASRMAINVVTGLMGFSPSDFDTHPLQVEFLEVGRAFRVDVENYWQIEPLERRFHSLAPRVLSWDEFDRAVRRDLPELVFAADAVRLHGHPFNPGVAERLQRLLEMLAMMKRCILPDGTYGEQWHQQWERWFKGGELFSDSSATEKSEFDAELTFKHPAHPGISLKCPWHGKVNTPKLRIHFSWPITRDEPVYVVYIGPKLTKR